MERKNIFKILFIALVITFMPKVVFASNCDLTQGHEFTGDGESLCTLEDDLELDTPITISNGSVTIDLNGHNFTMTGSGNAINVTNTGSLTISGNGTISTNPGAGNSQDGESLIFDSTGNLTINGGTFENGVHAQNAGEVTINNGTFNGTYGASFVNNTNLVINNGTFNGNFAGASIGENTSQKIYGGTFQGGTFGIVVTDDSINKLLYGGTFKGINDDSYSIVITSENEDNGFFNKLLGDNYHYSNKFKVLRKDLEDYNFGIGSSAGAEENVVKYYAYVSDTKNVSVIDGAPTAEQKIDTFAVEEETTEKNPETGSKLYIYIIAFLLVTGTALTVTYKYQKNNR